jgi:diguanylate cyclase (GGDEF)-like protein
LLVIAFNILHNNTALAVLPSPSARFHVLSLQQGLTIGTVEAIYQDSEGFMWLGGSDGLVRYDAYEFEAFRYQVSSTRSISSDIIWDILEDRRGNLWVATEKGLNRFYRDTESFTSLRHEPDNPNSLVADTARSLALDAEGHLWIGTYGGVSRYNPSTETFTNFVVQPKNKQSLSSNLIRQVAVGQDGTIWLATEGGGLNRLDPTTGIAVQFTNELGNEQSLSHSIVNAVLEDSDGIIWAGTELGLNRLDKTTGVVYRYRFNENSPYSLVGSAVSEIIEDSDGYLWIGTNEGLNVLDKRSGIFVHLKHSDSDRQSIAGDTIRSLFEDINGDMWIGGFPEGVSFLNKLNAVFKTYRHNPSMPGSLNSQSVLSFVEDKSGQLWVGTDGGGINVFTPDGALKQYYTAITGHPKDPGHLSGNAILSLAEDNSGNIWVGTWGAGLNRLEPESGDVEHFFYEYNHPENLPNNNVWVVHIDAENSIWTGTIGGGLSRYIAGEHRFETFIPIPDDDSSLSSTLVWSIHHDSENNLWVGTGKGLNRLDHKTHAIERFVYDKNNPNSLSGNVVSAIHEDEQGILWIGSRDGGLNRFDPKLKRVKRYTREMGLASNSISSIEQDRSGYIWLGTKHGLARFDPKKEEFKNYSFSHGLQDSKFNIGASLRLSSGELVFGGTKGFVRFLPENVQKNDYIPPVVLRHFQIFNREVVASNNNSPLTSALSRTQSITLTYDQSVFSFKFAALSYRNPEKNRYAYRLVGFDKFWSFVEDQRSATYTNLDPGTYTFELTASNNEGVWSKTPRSIKVIILPPFWKTWWAYTIYSLIIFGALAAVFLLHRRRMAYEIAMNRKLDLQVKRRTRELREKNFELEKANAKLEIASYTDTLTGLYNRRFLFNFLPHDLAKVMRIYVDWQAQTNAPLPRDNDILFFLIDADYFKSVNDSYGHFNGDIVLKKIADILTKECRVSDSIIRWGGEEFLLVCRFNNRSDGPEIAERLRRSVEQSTFELENYPPIKMTCSIGYACYPFNVNSPTSMSPEHVIALADWCLYTVKNNKRNGWMGMLHSGENELTAQEIKNDPKCYLNSGEISYVSSVKSELVIKGR